jgi:hypothetical protein
MAGRCLQLRHCCNLPLGMKTILEFFGIPETDFKVFRSDSSVTVFFENGIGFRNFLSESVSESAWCFTDRFLRLPVFVGNYRICVSEFHWEVRKMNLFCKKQTTWWQNNPNMPNPILILLVFDLTSNCKSWFIFGQVRNFELLYVSWHKSPKGGDWKGNVPLGYF